MKQQLKALLVDNGDSFIKHNSKVERQIGINKCLPKRGKKKFDGPNMALKQDR